MAIQGPTLGSQEGQSTSGHPRPQASTLYLHPRSDKMLGTAPCTDAPCNASVTPCQGGRELLRSRLWGAAEVPLAAGCPGTSLPSHHMQAVCKLWGIAPPSPAPRGKQLLGNRMGDLRLARKPVLGAGRGETPCPSARQTRVAAPACPKLREPCGPVSWVTAPLCPQPAAAASPTPACTPRAAPSPPPAHACLWENPALFLRAPHPSPPAQAPARQCSAAPVLH